MPFDLLHFGSGTQALHYFLFSYISIIGTIEAVAVRYDKCDLIWIQGVAGYWLGALLVAGTTIWFLAVDDELFIPGLAGGELFTIFGAAFVAALPTVRLINLLIGRARVLYEATGTREEESVP